MLSKKIQLLEILFLIATASLVKSQNEFVSESWGSTDIKLTKLKYIWTIKNYRFCCSEVGENLESPRFHSHEGDECKWYLDIYPKGENEAVDEYVSLYLYSVNCNTTANVNFSVLNGKGERHLNQSFIYKYLPPKSWGFVKYTRQSTLLNKDSDYLPNETLTIVCDITFVLNKETRSGRTTITKQHLADDLKVLYENQELSDITLSSNGGKKFQVHKAILAARSPTFKTLFTKINEEKNYTDNVVEITNTNHAVLGELLRYIYTDKVDGLDKLAPDLLGAAHNYEVKGLKTICENAMIADLSANNAVNYFILADKYCATELKNCARNFIVAHVGDLVNSEDFRQLFFKQPRLAVEAVQVLG